MICSKERKGENRIADTKISFSALREQYMRNGEGFLLVYSIASRESFKEIHYFHQQILRVKDVAAFPVIIVGNKCDLEFQREVGREGEAVLHRFLDVKILFHMIDNCCFIEGRELGRSLGCMVAETSAKEGINVDEVFHLLVRRIRLHNRVCLSDNQQTELSLEALYPNRPKSIEERY